LGAATLATNVGDDRYALLARVRFESVDGDVGVPLEADRYVAPVGNGIALSDGQGVLVGDTAAEVELGDLPTTKLWPVMYDLDDNGVVNLRDLTRFATAFRHDMGTPWTWASDYDHDGKVGLRDLSLFASAFRKKHTDAGLLGYNEMFPIAWREPAEAAALEVSAGAPRALAATIAASDAAIAEQYSPAGDATTLSRDPSAWSLAAALQETHGRRRASGRPSDAAARAIDLLLLDPRA
jgi:hypothetical protein